MILVQNVTSASQTTIFFTIMSVIRSISLMQIVKGSPKEEYAKDVMEAICLIKIDVLYMILIVLSMGVMEYVAGLLKVLQFQTLFLKIKKITTIILLRLVTKQQTLEVLYHRNTVNIIRQVELSRKWLMQE